MIVVSKYRKKPVVIDAAQWWDNFDEDSDFPMVRPLGPDNDSNYSERCEYCGEEKATPPLGSHGWIDTLEGGHIVCPRDFVITGVRGEHYPCKPDIFEETYELVEEEGT